MTLWGNNDNLTSAGTVSLDYTSGIGTGNGTAFGAVGTGVTGDIIRFGFRGAEGTYFGDAVIQDVIPAPPAPAVPLDGTGLVFDSPTAPAPPPPPPTL